MCLEIVIVDSIIEVSQKDNSKVFKVDLDVFMCDQIYMDISVLKLLCVFLKTSW